MSLTGLNLRHRLRRRAVKLLDRMIVLLDDGDDDDAETSSVPTPASPPPPAPSPVAPATEPVEAEPLTPLPDIPTARTRPPLDAASKTAAPKTAAPETAAPETAAPETAAPKKVTTPAGKKAKATPEERQAKHWSRTRAGVLRYVHDKGGEAPLRDMHDYSESTFFVAHVGFSRLMEELTDEGLLDYDHDAAVASLTDAGRAEIL